MAVTTALDRPFTLERPSFNPAPATLALASVIGGALYLNAAVNGRQALLFLVGTCAGVALYHAAFGFTASWRTFITDRRGAGIRAQMLMLAVTCAVFFPLLATGQLFGQTLRGSVSPAGVSVIAGAFLFGVGMQLGGGCASGTLYSTGGGNTRMLATLAAFIAGSVIGTAHMPWWTSLPAAKPLSLITRFGAATALAISLSLFALLAIATVVFERRRHGSLADQRTPRRGWRRVLQGPWPPAAGAAALAAVNIATLSISGRPWGVTSAFALWGAKALMAVGVDVAGWPYWAAPAQTASLNSSVLADVTSVMDAGIILGAFAASAAAGRFAPAWRVPMRSLAAAIVGGLMLGYGARIAYGCNIGAFFSGVASGSVHGWIWLPSAFLGNVAGTRLRPFFGLRT